MNFLAKYINSLQSGTGFLISTLMRRPVISGMPPALSIELTNCCNLKCHECPSGSGTLQRKRGYMDTDLYMSLLREVEPYLLNLNLYFQGEPMLHPKFFEFLRAAGSVSTTVSTNGHLLSDENALKLASTGLKNLIISLDGLDQETYSAYRVGGDIEKVLSGIRSVSAAVRKERSGMKILIQVLVNRYNENQINDLKIFARMNNAVLSLKSMQFYTAEKAEEYMPADKKFRRYTINDKGLRTVRGLPRRCARLWFNPVVTWEGKVLPCCFDKDGQYEMGDLKNESMREIWHGRAFRHFRTMILDGREKIGICRNCTSGLAGIKT